MFKNYKVNSKGHLLIGGLDSVELAQKYGTPAYFLDIDKVKETANLYLSAARKAFGENTKVLYASKVLSCTSIYNVINEAGLWTDCVSGGEIYTANAANFPMEHVYFHGNNKPQNEINMAMDMGVYAFVVDSVEELRTINKQARERGIVQNILLRITPGIDPHTHKAISTGNIDSKFGNAIATGQASDIVGLALSFSNIRLIGLHCHIGSQIFSFEPYVTEVKIMTDFIAEIKRTYNYEIAELNLGGGFGVPYVEEDPDADFVHTIEEMGICLHEQCRKVGITKPRICIEPGRSIVANAGITIYKVGPVKEIPGFRNYVSIDGGMTDNPRYALYGSKYTVAVANKADKPKDYIATIAGRCCESGDLIGEGVMLQKPECGDYLAVFTTGAYNYSMASNYNRIPRPPVIFISDGIDSTAVRRETYEDIIKCDEVISNKVY